jgi:hypothetical protein
LTRAPAAGHHPFAEADGNTKNMIEKGLGLGLLLMVGRWLLPSLVSFNVAVIGGVLFVLCLLISGMGELRKIGPAKSGPSQDPPLGEGRSTKRVRPPETAALLARDLWLPVHIAYTDADSRRTERDIIIQHVDEARGRKDAVALTCWCEKAKASRTFIVDRIGEIIDPQSGETPRDPAKWLQERLSLPRYPGAAHRVFVEPDPPPCVLVWQRQPGDVEMYDITIRSVDVLGDVPVAIQTEAKRRRSAQRRSWQGWREFALQPKGPEQPLGIAWRSEDAPDADAIGWVRRLIAGERPSGASNA